MKKIVFFVLSLIIVLPVYAGKNEPPFLIELGSRPDQFMPEQPPSPIVSITSKVDSLVIKAVKLNRGNCRIGINSLNLNNPNPIRKLKFGEKALFYFWGPCEPIQIDVITDQGSYEFNKP